LGPLQGTFGSQTARNLFKIDKNTIFPYTGIPVLRKFRCKNIQKSHLQKVRFRIQSQHFQASEGGFSCKTRTVVSLNPNFQLSKCRNRKISIKQTDRQIDNLNRAHFLKCAPNMVTTRQWCLHLLRNIAQIRRSLRELISNTQPELHYNLKKSVELD
jgi:hypothetical protein